MTSASPQAAALRAAERSLREPAEGSDARGLVTMEIVDLQVSRLKVSASWDKSDDDALQQLTTLVSEAYDTIGAAVKLRYFEVLEAARQQSLSQGDAPAPQRTPPPARQRSVPDARQVDALLGRLVRDFEDLQRLERAHPPQDPRPAAPDREVSGTSENGRLRAVFTVAPNDDALTRLEADAYWFARQSHLQIADMVKQAMNDGLANIRSASRPEPNPYQQMSDQFARTAAQAAQVSRLAGLR